MQVEDGKKEPRDKVEGFKVTQTEKDEIKAYCAKHKHDKSNFYRNAIARSMARGE